MNSLLNKLFSKPGNYAGTENLENSNKYKDFIGYLKSLGTPSVEMEDLGISLSVSTTSPKLLAQLAIVRDYLKIEDFLINQDPYFFKSKNLLRSDIKNRFPQITNSDPFKILYLNGKNLTLHYNTLYLNYISQEAASNFEDISIDDFQLPTVEATPNENEENLTLRASLIDYYTILKNQVQQHLEQKKVHEIFNDWTENFTEYYKKIHLGQKSLYFSDSPEAPTVSKEIKTPKPSTNSNFKDAEYNKDQIHFAVLENLVHKAVVFDRSGSILYCNDRARTIFEIDRNKEKNIFNMLPLQLVTKLKADLQPNSYLQEKHVLGKCIETAITLTDGSSTDFEVSTSNNYTDSDSYCMLFKNITKKNASLANINREMENAQRNAKAKATFLSNMSHEIRTPLNVILGLSDILKKGENQDPQLFKENINGIDFSAKNLLSIVNDILDFSKIEAGKLAIQSHDFNIRKLINVLCSGFSTKAQEKGLLLNVHIAEDIPNIVIGDQYRINQILTNLIGNAIKFTPRGTVDILLKKLESSLPDTIKISFEIKDTGIGIPKDQLQSIFESFYQVQDQMTSKANGTGLGLAITKELVSLQKGTLTATSTIGQGSNFKFILPLTESKLEAIEGDSVEIHQKEQFLKGLRVLVAEDNTMNQFYIKQLLNNLDIEVDVVHNGQEAIDIYNSKGENYYQLIIMDMHMPIKDGIEAIKEIRNSRKYKLRKVPLVICSADVFPESRKEAVKAGIDFYLTKPLEADALKEVLFWLVSDEESLDISQNPSKEEQRNYIAIDQLKATFDHDDAFILSLLEIFIEETPEDYKSLCTCMDREFYTRASLLAHKMKSSFMNLGMTEQGHLLQQIEKNVLSKKTIPIAVKHYHQFKKVYVKTLLDVNILLIELKRH